MNTIKVTIVDAARWEPSQEEFRTALRQLHKNDTARRAVEEVQQQLALPQMLQHINAVKSRVLARRLLVKELCQPTDNSSKTEAKVLLTTTAYGKPITASFKEGEFSISHVHNWICCAYAPSGTIGVDITAIQPDKREVLWTILSETEIELLQRKPASQQPLCFAVYWSLKECILKALGVGLSSYLQMHEITLNFVDEESETLVFKRIEPNVTTSTLARPLTVKLKDHQSEKWMFSCVLIGGRTRHLIAVVNQGKMSTVNVEWRFESYEHVLNT